MRKLLQTILILIISISAPVMAQEISVLNDLEITMSLGAEYFNGDVVGLSGFLYDGRIKKGTKDKLNISYSFGLKHRISWRSSLGLIYKTGNISGSVRDYNHHSNKKYMNGSISQTSMYIDTYFPRSKVRKDLTFNLFTRVGVGTTGVKGSYITMDEATDYTYMNIPHVLLGLGYKKPLNQTLSLTMLVSGNMMLSDRVDGVRSPLGGVRDELYSIDIGIVWRLKPPKHCNKKEWFHRKSVNTQNAKVDSASLEMDDVGVQEVTRLSNLDSNIIQADIPMKQETVTSVDSLFNVYLLDTLAIPLSWERSEPFILKKTYDINLSGEINMSSFTNRLYVAQTDLLSMEVLDLFTISSNNYISSGIKEKLKDVAIFIRRHNIKACIIVSERKRTTPPDINFVKSLCKVLTVHHDIPEYVLYFDKSSVNFIGLRQGIVVYIKE